MLVVIILGRDIFDHNFQRYIILRGKPFADLGTSDWFHLPQEIAIFVEVVRDYAGLQVFTKGLECLKR
jgi:hypothetical protein